jgi:hypothetical protein
MYQTIVTLQEFIYLCECRTCMYVCMCVCVREYIGYMQINIYVIFLWLYVYK